MALSFNGTSAVCTVNSAVATAVPITMACWFTVTAVTVSMSLISLAQGSTITNRFRLAVRGDQTNDPVGAESMGSGTARWATTSTGVTIGPWYHGTAVFAASNSRQAYINGGSSGTNGVSNTPANIDETTMGKPSTSASTLWHAGKIAEAAIWNIALSTSEIAALANGVSPLRVRRASLQAYWPLGFASPDTDYSGGLRNLTITNATVADHAPVSPMFGVTVPSPYIVAAAPPVGPPAGSLALLGVGR